MKKLFTALLILPFVALPAFAQFGAFGISAAIYEDDVLVSQPIQGGEPGLIFIFRQDDEGTWQRVDTLMAPEPSPRDFFAYSMQVYDGLLYVGAPSAEAGEGKIYVLQRDADSGTYTHITHITGTEEDHIGASVAISDAMIFSGGMQGHSHITVFERGEDGWLRANTVSAEDIGEEEAFGMAIAMDDTRLYVGAPATGDDAGAVHVFSRDDFSHEAVLTASDSSLRALGASLLADGYGGLLAGAPGIRPNSQPNAPPPPGGVVEFHQDESGAWFESATFEADNEDDEFDIYGLSLLSDGSHLWIGALLANGFAGQVYEFSRDDAGQWQAADTLSAEGSFTFGQAMAHSGDLMVVTAPAARQQMGAAYVFRHAEGAWHNEGSIDSGEEPPEPETAGIEMVASTESVECADSLAWQFGCSNVDLLAFLPMQDIGGDEPGVNMNDIWGWTDPETGREYALAGRSDGTAFVDVTDPGNPVYVGNLALTEGARPSSWRDIKVYSNHAFVVADNAGEHGMQIFDLTQLRTAENMPVEFEGTAHYAGFHSAHNVIINEDTGFAYAVGISGGGQTCGGGLHMVNIQDPLNPEFAGCFAHEGTGRAETGYSHDAQCVIYNGPDTEHRDKEICLGSNETHLSIADVTDKENPVDISSATYPKVAYAHQGWLTDDHRYFYMNDELDELGGEVVGTRTLIWDLTDLDDPVLVTEYMSDNLSSDHNLYIQGDVMYQSNYKSGLRIFDISNRAAPTLVGFFDTFPGGEDDPGFNGSWSNYPYFESGTIIVTSIGEGLFVLKRRQVDI